MHVGFFISIQPDVSRFKITEVISINSASFQSISQFTIAKKHACSSQRVYLCYTSAIIISKSPHAMVHTHQLTICHLLQTILLSQHALHLSCLLGFFFTMSFHLCTPSCVYQGYTLNVFHHIFQQWFLILSRGLFYIKNTIIWNFWE